MRYLLSVLAIAVCFVRVADASQVPAASVKQGSEEQRVLAAEDDYVAARLRRDVEALRTIIDSRFVHTASDGATTGKNPHIQRLINLKMASQTMRERSVLIEGDSASISGTAETRLAASGQQPERVTSQRYTSKWVKRGRDWRLIALQMQQGVNG